MKLFMAAVVPLFLAAPAMAAEPTITDACMRAVALELGDHGYVAAGVQAFPELSPPRVQLTVVDPAGGSEIANLLDGGKAGPQEVGEARCEFASARPPFGLSKFCVADRCILGLPASRLEELQLLLAREGL